MKIKPTIENAKKAGLVLGGCHGKFYWQHPRGAHYGRDENCPSLQYALMEAAELFFDDEIGWIL